MINAQRAPLGRFPSGARLFTIKKSGEIMDLI